VRRWDSTEKSFRRVCWEEAEGVLWGVGADMI
jgi:hypothetical protein